MIKHVSIDIETFSDIDIKSAGAYKYVRSPKFEILLIAYAIGDGPVKVVDLTTSEPTNDIFSILYDSGYILHAYNASFEYNAINIWLQRMGLPEIPISRWRCTMVHGLYCGYPAGLGTIGEALGLPQEKQKLKTGRELIQKFCVPKKPTAKDPNRVRIYPNDEPEKWELFKQYNAQDVEAEREIERRLSKWPLPEREQKLWEDDILMNKRGVGVDMDLVEAAIEIGAAEQEELVQEAKELSGLANPKSGAQLSKWLTEELGDSAPDNLRKATVAGMLEGDIDSDTARRMLELRQLTSKTSTAKYDAIKAAVCEDQRVRGISFFYGARTGRWAGRLIQLQNLPQNHIEPLEFARQLVKDRDAESLKACYGSLSNTLSQLIRTALVPAPGYTYAVADFSAIEARTVAFLADQEWVLDAFRAGKDIYCETASQMFGVPVEKHGPNGHLRQRGKVAVLALGYGGGEGALINMGALKMGIPEEDLPEIKRLWRETNDRIPALWRMYEASAFKVLNDKGPQECPHGITFRKECDPDTNQEFMTVELPTGRKLFYAHPFTAPAPRYPDRQSLHYYGIEQQSKKFKPVDTFGGKLVENCLAEGTLVLTDNGLKPIEQVTPRDYVWDGSYWVSHDGVIDKGVQTTIGTGSLRMTPDHKIFTANGWCEFGKTDGHYWAPVSLPDGITPSGAQQTREDRVGVSLRLRQDNSGRGARRNEDSDTDEVLRMHEDKAHIGEYAYSRNDEASSLRGMACNEAAMHGANAQSVEKLRRPRDKGMRPVAKFLRKLLGGYGTYLLYRIGSGQNGQQHGIQSGKLSVGIEESKRQEHEELPIHTYPAWRNDRVGTERENGYRENYAPVQIESQLADRIVIDRAERKEHVYDIRNSGPWNRFTVYDPASGRYRIVHNCVQAVARDCLAEMLLRLQKFPEYRTVFTVHDEIILEAPVELGEKALNDLLGIMAEPIPWAPGLPLKGAGFIADFYQKD